MKRIQKINLNKKLLNNSIRKEKAQICADRLLFIMKHDKFKDAFLNMPRDYWLQGETSKLKNLSNLEIYNLLMSGKEEWNNEVDYEIDLIVDDFVGKIWSKVVGYMNPGKPTVYVNTRFFDTMTKRKVCSNFAHEWFHTMGARHGGKMFRLSLAYFMNTVIEKLYKEFYESDRESNEVNLTKYCVRSWKTLWFKRCYLIRK